MHLSLFWGMIFSLSFLKTGGGWGGWGQPVFHLIVCAVCIQQSFNRTGNNVYLYFFSVCISIMCSCIWLCSTNRRLLTDHSLRMLMRFCIRSQIGKWTGHRSHPKVILTELGHSRSGDRKWGWNVQIGKPTSFLISWCRSLQMTPGQNWTKAPFNFVTYCDPFH